ncbi:hypothetical protein FY034_10450 [Trichlorobacter lovleyi]|uniref:hypothetical protein n=1 Tax=Trichlorobacter lovleyi TaxID=313985 RepID=UPI00223F4B13|nr:hypothetical protein [Trichlorobacter lovleyi]QOX79334.1 hypothetical protein FY034_10450 [Trichlorobacter lovleyi]
MSNILEALRKAQDEKSRAADQTITGREALIAHRTTRSWAGANKRVIWLGCSGAVLLAIVGWLLYGPSKPASEPKAPLTAAAPINMPAEPPLPPQQAPPAPQPAPAASAVPSPAPPAIQAPAPLPAAPQANDDEERSPSRRHRTAASPPAVAASQAAQPSRSAEATISGVPEGVKLTGIAWQDSRKMRRAVINDVLVGEGAVVAGAKVLEIRPALVRFEKNGTVFEAALPR